MMTDVTPYLERICELWRQPAMRGVFQDFNKTMHFTFPDLQRNFTLRFSGDGSAAWEEQTVIRPDIKVTMSSDTLSGILDHTINPIQAYLTLRLKVVGPMEDLLKLWRLLGA